jgi:hypothetical protein
MGSNTNLQKQAQNLAFPGDLAAVINVLNGNWTAQSGIPLFEVAYNVGGGLTIGNPVDGAAQHGMAAFLTNIIIKNVAGVATSIPFMETVGNNSVFQADGAACTVAVPGADFGSVPVFSAINSGTLNVGALTQFQAAGAGGAGVTLSTRTGFKVFQFTTATMTTQLGLDIDTLTGATTNIGARILNGNVTYTSAPSIIALQVAPATYTYNFAGALLPTVISVSPTFVLTSGSNAFGGGTVLSTAPIYNVQATPFGVGNGISLSATIQANTGTGMGITGYQGNSSSVTITTAGAGTFTSGTINNYVSQPTINASGSTITTWKQFSAQAPTLTAGTITTLIGLDVASQSGAGVTTGIGIRNADITVFTPSANQTLAAATTVNPNATVIKVIQTSGANITLTATPTITAGQDGQKLHIINVSTVASSSFTFQSVGSLAGSTLSLGATTRVVGIKGSLTLVYNATLTRWVEVGFNGGTFG